MICHRRKNWNYYTGFVYVEILPGVWYEIDPLPKLLIQLYFTVACYGILNDLSESRLIVLVTSIWYEIESDVHDGID